MQIQSAFTYSQSQTIDRSYLALLHRDNDDSLDQIDLGNSRGLKANAETTLYILEEKVNARLEAKLEAEAPVEEADDYWSPERTAERIVNFALKFYEKFADKNGESEGTLTKFLDIVKGAIGEGIGEAEEILGTVSDETKSTIQKTREKIDELLEKFRVETQSLQ